MAEISDVEFYEGTREIHGPTVVLDAATARLALDQGELEDLVEKALNALEMSGRSIVFVQADAA